MPTIIEVLNAANGGGDEAAAAIALLEQHRRRVARSLLASVEPETTFAGRLSEIEALASAAFPWAPVSEDIELAQAVLERWRPSQRPPVNVLMAAMALAPAHHFPIAPLADVPAWLRPVYARYLLARARLFLHTGEADRYASHGTAAMGAVRAAVAADRLPDAAELAGIGASTDSTLVYFNAQSLKAYFRDKAWLTEWILLKQGSQLGCGFPLTSAAKPRIGVLHRVLSPGTETYHLLAHLEGRDRSTAEVRLYVLDAAANAMTEAFTPWVDAIVRLPGNTPAAVAQLRSDRLDLCLMTNNLGWGLARETAIAAHRLAPVQMVCGACPATPGLSSSDIFLSSAESESRADAQDDYVERLALLPGAVGHFGYAHDQDPATLTVTRAQLGAPDDHILFFSGANYYKIEPEVLEIWAEILARIPGSHLGLMPFNPNWGGAYPLALFQRRLNEVLTRFGVAPSRVRLIGQVPTRADLLSIMGLADIYLDSFPYSGACSLVDPLTVGLPIVAHAGDRLRTAQGASLLRAEGLESAICADPGRYVERAVRLAGDPAYRAQESAAARAAAAGGLTCLKTEGFARRFGEACLNAVAGVRERIAAQRASTPDQLRRMITEAAEAALADPPPALLRLHDVDLARQWLAPWLETLVSDGAAAGRVLDVGACVGKLAAPFLDAGMRVEMFEPDPGCAAALSELVGRYPERATHWPCAVIGEPAEAASFHKRSVGALGPGGRPDGGGGIVLRVAATTLAEHLRAYPGDVDLVQIGFQGAGLELLRGIDFGEALPKAVMVKFGVELPGQPRAPVAQAIADMAGRGYGAIVFEYRKLDGFGVSNWDHELGDVGFDVAGLGDRGDGFGNIVFYRQHDTVLLTCLAQLLERYAPAPRRPAFAPRNAAVRRKRATAAAPA